MLSPLSLALLPAAALAVPAEVPYVGYLTKEGVPYNESVTITVELWDQAEGGTSLWGPQEYAVAPEGGVFAIVLGASNAVELDTALLPASGWLSFTVEGSLLPQRQALQSVPYAVWAGNSQSCEEANSLGDWGCQDGQIIKWVAATATWTCANDLGGGAAQYTAGTGLLLAGTEFSVNPGWSKVGRRACATTRLRSWLWRCLVGTRTGRTT